MMRPATPWVNSPRRVLRPPAWGNLYQKIVRCQLGGQGFGWHPLLATEIPVAVMVTSQCRRPGLADSRNRVLRH
jgi:hypothetical protein